MIEIRAANVLEIPVDEALVSGGYTIVRRPIDCIGGYGRHDLAGWWNLRERAVVKQVWIAACRRRLPLSQALPRDLHGRIDVGSAWALAFNRRRRLAGRPRQAASTYRLAGRLYDRWWPRLEPCCQYRYQHYRACQACQTLHHAAPFDVCLDTRGGCRPNLLARRRALSGPPAPTGRAAVHQRSSSAARQGWCRRHCRSSFCHIERFPGKSVTARSQIAVLSSLG